MKLTCPNCHEQLSLAAMLEHEAARKAVSAALEVPAPLGRLVLQYCGLFKPAQRSLSMERFAAIINELLPMIKDAQVERNGRIWPAPQEYWRMAFESMLTGKDKLTLPLKSHGYLLEIIAGYANKGEAKAEKQAEQGRKYGEIHGDPRLSSTLEANVVLPAAGVSGTSHLALTRGFATTEKMVQHDKKAKRAEMPAEVRATIKKMTGKAKP